MLIIVQRAGAISGGSLGSFSKPAQSTQQGINNVLHKLTRTIYQIKCWTILTRTLIIKIVTGMLTI